MIKNEGRVSKITIFLMEKVYFCQKTSFHIISRAKNTKKKSIFGRKTSIMTIAPGVGGVSRGPTDFSGKVTKAL